MTGCFIFKTSVLLRITLETQLRQKEEEIQNYIHSLSFIGERSPIATARHHGESGFEIAGQIITALQSSSDRHISPDQILSPIRAQTSI